MSRRQTSENIAHHQTFYSTNGSSDHDRKTSRRISPRIEAIGRNISTLSIIYFRLILPVPRVEQFVRAVLFWIRRSSGSNRILHV